MLDLWWRAGGRSSIFAPALAGGLRWNSWWVGRRMASVRPSLYDTPRAVTTNCTSSKHNTHISSHPRYSRSVRLLISKTRPTLLLTVAKKPTAIPPDHLPNCAPNRHTGSSYPSSPHPGPLLCLFPTSRDPTLGAYIYRHCHSITTKSGASEIEPIHASSIRIFSKHNNVLRACKPARCDITQ